MIFSIFKLLRPRQWTKNFFVLAPLFFSISYMETAAWQQYLLAMVCFILAAGAVYVFNDICDVEEDKTHPKQRLRPIASGKVSPIFASIIALICLANTALILTSYLPQKCSIIMFIYLVLQLFYTQKIKHVAIFDVLIIAAGFVLRVLMGAHAIEVPVSPWIIVTVYLLALFLGFGKRHHEFSTAGYADKRQSLKRYNQRLLDQLIGISCVATLMTYTLYTVETARLLGKTELVYTVLFVMIGLFRYLQVLYVDEKGGEPERVLLGDLPFLLNGIIWFGVTIAILAGVSQ